MKQAYFSSEPRTSYTYRFADGTTSTDHIGDIDENDEELTEEMIELIYEMDEEAGDETQPGESDDEDSYIYSFSDGTTSTIKVGDVDENGAVVTAEMIRLLHQMDDKEMYNNRKNTKAPIGKWEVPGIERWKAAHPGELLPTRHHIPLDALTKNEEGDDDCDKGNLAKASIADSYIDEKLIDDLERLHEVVSMMKPEQQWLYRRIVLDRATLAEVGNELGISKQAVSERMMVIKKFIKKSF